MGSEASGQVLNATTKLMEAFLRFIKFLIERSEKATQNDLNKIKLEEMKDVKKQRKALEHVEGTFGLVKAKELQRSGLPVTMMGLSMTKKEATKFSEYLKRNGVSAALITNKQKGDGEKTYAMLIKQRDAETIKKIADRMTLDAKLEAIDSKINEIQGHENPTEQDRTDLARLQKERDRLMHEDTMKFNGEQNIATFKDICEGRKELSKSFNEALNHYTDRDYSRNAPYFVCERTNPQNYIECRSMLEMFHGKEYTKTDYAVFNEGVEKLRTHDGRFEGREKNYWEKVKVQIKEAGELTDDLLIFDTESEFRRFKELYTEQQKELDGLEQTGEVGRDYDAMCEQLKQQLDNCGAEIDNKGYAIDKITHEPLFLKDGQSAIEQAGISEAVCIAKQIKNYNMLAKMETEIAIKQLEIENLAEGTGDHIKAQAELSNQKAAYNNALEIERNLKHDRSRVNGAQAEQEVDREWNTSQKDNEKDRREEEQDANVKCMEEWKNEISNTRQHNPEQDKNGEKVLENKQPER